MIKIFLFVITISIGSLAWADKCGFEPESQSHSVQWTAFKTTAKTPVAGTFTDINLIKVDSSKAPASSLEDWLKSTGFAINIKSVDTKNPDRDKTLSSKFFSLMKSSLEYLPGERFIHGKVKNINTKDQTLIATIDMNAIKRDLNLKYKMTGNLLEISGSLDLFDFALKDAHSSLHKACFDLHKGEDGVSKTWTQVDFIGKVQLRNTCKK